MVVEAQDTIAALEKRNGELQRLLELARDQLGEMRTKLAEVSTPPQTFATFVQWAGKYADIVANGRRMRVAVLPAAAEGLKSGDEVLLNAMSVIVGIAEPERAGQAAIVREVIDDDRVLVVSRGEDERVVILIGGDAAARVHEGDTVIIDPRTGFASQKVERTGVEALLLEEVPDVDYSVIGGLGGQIERIRDAIELPLRHPELYREHALQPPKGLLLYGPPGLWQDADREGRRALAGRRDRRRPQLLLVRQGSRTAQQVRRARPSATFAPSLNGHAPRRTRAPRWWCSSTRWTHCSALVAPASVPTWRPRSCRNCSPSSTASRTWGTSS